MTTTTNVAQVKLNVMNQSQYDSATKNPTELYMVTDAQLSYNDLTDKPVVDQTYSATSTNAQSGVAVASAISGKADDSAVVHKTGNETIAGTKTFSTTPVVGTLATDNNSTSAASTAYVKSNLSSYVPTSRKINNKALTSDITLSASDVSALPSSTTINDLTTSTQQDALNSGVTSTVVTQVTTNKNDISTINGKIPSAATTTNQLADKSFVNSSISTNTAYFIGTFNSVADLEAYSGTLTNNDYAFVISTDSAGNTVYNRYKYTTATNPASWQFEYALNNSSFTADQWAAVNSGATTTNIGQITTNKDAIGTLSSLTTTEKTNLVGAINELDSGKVDANTAITGATKCKITYDSKGLVTAGADLAASDIPSLTLSKISDVTATATELNVLDGITATTAELNYTDGVTSNIQTQLNAKAADNAVVKLTGNQTIAGVKTFTSDLTLQQASVQPVLKSTGYTKGTAPTSDTYMCHRRYLDNGGNSVFHEYYYIPRDTNRPSYILRFQDVSSASASSSSYKDIITANYDGTNANYAINATTATAPTPSTSDNSTKIATTAFVKSQGYITSSGSITGSAAKLTTARTIDGVDFDGSASITHFGVCSTAAATAAKTVDCAGFKLETGANIYVKFSATNTAGNPTLNVNGTGAKAVYYNNAAISAGQLKVNRILHFIYNGTQYEFVGEFDTSNNNQVRYSNNIKAAAAITANKFVVGTSSGYKQVASGVTFDIDYPILHAASAISSGSTGNNNYLILNSINIATEINNSSWTGAQYATYYLVLSALSGKTATIDSSIVTTTVPTSADNKFYIPLGITYSTTQGVFMPENRVMAYVNGAFQEYMSYAGTAGAVAWGNVSGKPSSFTPTAHNQAANTINAMTGYSKPTSTSAISTSDTLNAAVGKLEKALDSKQASGSYVTYTASTAVGTATKPAYVASTGVATACTYELNATVPSGAVFTDTKNTAGSTDTSSKIFLIGATSQAANPQTYSHDTAFVDANGRVNSAAPASDANDTTVATTKWVKDQGYSGDTNVVHKTGAETVAGVKTFSDNINANTSVTVGQHAVMSYNSTTEVLEFSFV